MTNLHYTCERVQLDKSVSNHKFAFHYPGWASRLIGLCPTAQVRFPLPWLGLKANWPVSHSTSSLSTTLAGPQGQLACVPQHKFAFHYPGWASRPLACVPQHKFAFHYPGWASRAIGLCPTAQVRFPLPWLGLKANWPVSHRTSSLSTTLAGPQGQLACVPQDKFAFHYPGWASRPLACVPQHKFAFHYPGWASRAIGLCPTAQVRFPLPWLGLTGHWPVSHSTSSLSTTLAGPQGPVSHSTSSLSTTLAGPQGHWPVSHSTSSLSTTLAGPQGHWPLSHSTSSLSTTLTGPHGPLTCVPQHKFAFHYPGWASRAYIYNHRKGREKGGDELGDKSLNPSSPVTSLETRVSTRLLQSTISDFTPSAHDQERQSPTPFHQPKTSR
ncbi:hypothetical protein ACOMHN_009212 [Nucella lapillus]